jgi:hypothetical protein
MKRVPEGEWRCRICAKEKHIPRRARKKRVMKKTSLEKLIMPKYTDSTKKEKAPLVHDDSDEPKLSSSRRPLLVRIKLGSSTLRFGQTDKADEKRHVETGSNSPDKKSTGDNNNSSDMKISSSRQPILVPLKLGSAEKSEEKKLVEQKSGADDDNGSDKMPTGDDNVVSNTKNSQSKEGKNGVPTCENDQEVAIVLIYKFILSFENSFAFLDEFLTFQNLKNIELFFRCLQRLHLPQYKLKHHLMVYFWYFVFFFPFLSSFYFCFSSSFYCTSFCLF